MMEARDERRSARPHHPSRQHPREERRKLSSRSKPRSKGRLKSSQKSPTLQSRLRLALQQPGEVSLHLIAPERVAGKCYGKQARQGKERVADALGRMWRGCECRTDLLFARVAQGMNTSV